MNNIKIQDPLAVANFIIKFALENGQPVTNLKLQKVMFFLQGYCLYTLKMPLINSEFSKWQYGPVVERVYKEFRDNGAEIIDTGALELSLDDFKIIEIAGIDANTVENEEAFINIKKVTKQLLSIDAWELVDITHKHSSWSNYRNQIMTNRRLYYQNDEIEQCFADNKGELLRES